MSDGGEECECKAGAPAWMATFSDMATLMLCFFVLLLSFANMDVQNFRSALGSVKEAFGVQFKVKGSFEAMNTSPVELSNIQSSDKLFDSRAIDEESVAIVEQFVREEGLEDVLEVEGDARGVIVRAKDRVLFDSGQAALKDEAIPILTALRKLFDQFKGVLAIEGHTDNRPISTVEFPSNWELSGARAASVLKQMHAEGLPLDAVHIAGYADLHPMASNDTEEGRASNRRVEFVFEYDDEFAQEPAKAYDVLGLDLDNEEIRLDAIEKHQQKTNAPEAETAPAPRDAGASRRETQLQIVGDGGADEPPGHGSNPLRDAAAAPGRLRDGGK